jgi:hypothetical protein
MFTCKKIKPKQHSFSPSLSLLFAFALSTALSTTLSLQQAHARRPRPKPQLTITKALQQLTWGMNHNELIKFLEGGIAERYQKLVAGARDAVEVQGLREREKKEKKELREAYVSFSGQRTGYEVTLLKDDFAHNNSETMLRSDEGSVQRYYFFRYDKLWKLMVVYPSSDEAGFQRLVNQVKGHYGRPQKTNWETPYGGARRLVEAIWQDAKTQMTLEDKSALYSRFVMRFVSLEAGQEIQALHEQKREQKAQAKTRPTTLDVDIFAEDDKVEDVVDQITGQSHEVNMNRLEQIKAEDVPAE